MSPALQQIAESELAAGFNQNELPAVPSAYINLGNNEFQRLPFVRREFFNQLPTRPLYLVATEMGIENLETLETRDALIEAIETKGSERVPDNQPKIA